MSEQISEKPKLAATGAESPTTAREPDFDDEPHEGSSSAQGPERLPSPTNHPKRVSFQEQEEEVPPPKPPRPMSPQAQAEATLVEAFPTMDTKVIKAVLVASGGKVEPAFNALLGMSDPNYVEEEQPPPPPPRPRGAQRQMSQLESDELYARQLAEHYQGASSGFGSRNRGDPQLPQRRGESGLKPNELYDDREHSFFDDDLPVIRQNIQKGFQETQSKVNKWITDFKKKLDGDEEDEPPAAQGSRQQGYQRQDYGPSQSEQIRGIRRSADHPRRSGDRERYDADPQELSDDFRELELHDNESAPRRPNRPLANPNLFKPTPTGAPQSGPVDEVDALYSQPTPINRQPSPGTGKGGKKWQPLTSVAPNPEAEDNDPFSLGDSDEEEAKKTDLKPEDTERLKKSASVSEGASGEASSLQPAERSGSMSTRDKAAEDLLKGKT